MKVFGKKTLVFDCSWELEDDTKLRTKLENKQKKTRTKLETINLQKLI